MITFVTLLLFALNFITVDGNKLVIGDIWISLGSTEDEETRSVDPDVPVRQWPEEQLASSASNEVAFEVVDLKKLVEDRKKNGPLWKFRDDASQGDQFHTEQTTNYESSLNETDGKITLIPPINISLELQETTKSYKQYDLDRNEINSNKMSSEEIRRYSAEIKAGDQTQLLGVNHHVYQPRLYRNSDLGRRSFRQIFRDTQREK